MIAAEFSQAEYRRLLADALPHVIHTDEENQRCIAELETLLNRGKLSAQAKELADLLTVLVEKYEERYRIHLHLLLLSASSTSWMGMT